MIPEKLTLKGEFLSGRDRLVTERLLLEAEIELRGRHNPLVHVIRCLHIEVIEIPRDYIHVLQKSLQSLESINR